eukprot:comp16785_c0_seq1/m.15164 comp16785_c0_seq1/g.15164  ORF comp16785_c0_seq1/g.15164 comp16785_c0_seq1/m.15164 type:complete len:335 (-) comp16785_c0_seq1:83-1087(-)
MSDLQLKAELKGHTDRVWCASWSPNGQTLATCSGDKTVRLWGVEGGQWVCVGTLEGAHTRTVRCVAWSPCGRLLATASFDATTCIWEKAGADYELAATLEGHENEVKCAAWSKSGNLLATCSRDKSVWVWEVEQDNEFECLSVIHEHTQDVKMVKFHPTKEVLVSCSYDDSIGLYGEEDDDWELFDKLTGHSSTVWAIDFDATGDRMVSVSDDQTVKIWQAHYAGNQQGIEVPRGRFKYVCTSTLSGYHDRPIYTVSWSPVSNLIATGGGDDIIHIFMEDTERKDSDAPQWTLAGRQIAAHSQDVNGLAWHPTDRDLLASVSDDTTVRLWVVKA